MSSLFYQTILSHFLPIIDEKIEAKMSNKIEDCKQDLI